MRIKLDTGSPTSAAPPRDRMTSTSRVLLTLVVALGLLAAACGSSNARAGIASLEAEPIATTDAASEATAPSEVSGADSDEEALLAFTRCMRDNGIEVEDPTVDAAGNLGLGPVEIVAEGDAAADPDEVFAEVDAVFEECGEYLEGVSLGFEEQDFTEFEDTLLEYTQCMRDNGIDMDDPDLSGDGGLLFEVDPTDPDYRAAEEACANILAGFGPGLGGSPGESDNG